jgi:hypothetical protein
LGPTGRKLPSKSRVTAGTGGQNVVISNNFYTRAPAVVLGAADAAAVVGNAGFLDAAAGNFRLAAGSAAIDTGIVLPF